VAEAIGLGRHLVLSKAEEDAGGRGNAAILADCCEAVIGALYVDGGLEPARACVVKQWAGLMEEAVTPPKDAKTALQEWAQGRGKPLPVYETVTMHGPPHDPIFEVRVKVDGLEPVTARGPSKRAAEQLAANEMLGKVKA
jgi:ribonuclease-3